MLWEVLANTASFLAIVAFAATLFGVWRVWIERPKIVVTSTWHASDFGRIVVRNEGHSPAKDFIIMVTTAGLGASGGQGAFFFQEDQFSGIRVIFVYPVGSSPTPEEFDYRDGADMLADQESANGKTALVHIYPEDAIAVSPHWNHPIIPRSIKKFDLMSQFWDRPILMMKFDETEEIEDD